MPALFSGLGFGGKFDKLCIKAWSEIKINTFNLLADSTPLVVTKVDDRVKIMYDT